MQSFRDKMAAFCTDATARGCHGLIASAGDVSPVVIDGVTAVHDLLADLVDEIRMVGYVRPPNATAILYAQRKLGRGHERYPRAMQDNNCLVTALSGIGDGKIHLDPSVVPPLIDQHSDDLVWISLRPGCEIADASEPQADALLSPDGRFEVAGKQMPALMQRIAREMPDCAVDPELVARAPDSFHDNVRTRTRCAPARDARNSANRINRPSPDQPFCGLRGMNILAAASR